MEDAIDGTDREENVPSDDEEGGQFRSCGTQMQDMEEQTGRGDNLPPVDNEGEKCHSCGTQMQDMEEQTDRGENLPPVDNEGEKFRSCGTQMQDMEEQTDRGENLPPVDNEGEKFHSRGTQMDDVEERTAGEENLSPVDSEGERFVSRETQTEDLSDSSVTDDSPAHVIKKVEESDPQIDASTDETPRGEVNSAEEIDAYKQEIESLKQKLAENKELENKLSSVNQKLRELEKRGTIQQKHYKDMLLKGKDHDVTLKVRNKKFRVHKNILRARSPVFAAMFTHNMKEAKDDVVDIEDCDPNSFLEFLEFVYVGSIEKLTVSKALGLYYTGDKYVFPDLKEMCVEHLKASMTANVISEVITMAKEHNEDELLACAMAFFATNLVDILMTEEWRRFLECEPRLASDLTANAVKNSYKRVECS